MPCMGLGPMLKSGRVAQRYAALLLDVWIWGLRPSDQEQTTSTSLLLNTMQQRVLW
jgi:hypothetical protein